ncbi:MATE family efflux transporter [Photobacterium sp. GJ3]|uniref:MATE family efflux transporter n=1 Tax=Photobacterium sp. GJ3 TaxID=2829502 RepID=UPI001B8AD175|nr:MATE family efflux transporter [Photobacterium sp. GJ3]QUJ68742.1 MATE family efflux transporter [Photobacterium sp. GJ3]
MSSSQSAVPFIEWAFVRRLMAIALPIALQIALFSSRSLVDILMLGQLNELDVAAIGIAGRALFVVTIMLIGVTTGGAMLSAQYWGAGNARGLKQSVALTLLMTTVVAGLSALVFVLMPQQVIGVATDHPEVIARGAEYLQITAISLFAIAWGSSVSVGLRAMHQPGISTFFSTVGIALNLFLNWVLIFGNLGMPAYGIVGAAWATAISGLVEIVLLFGYLHFKRHLTALTWSVFPEVMDMQMIKRFLKLSLPTTLNHLAWSGGIFMYHAIIGQAGVDGLVALSVMTPIESLALALLIGISNASAVLIGNHLGGNRMEEAYRQAWAVVVLNLACGIVIAGGMLLIRDPILDLFAAMTPQTRELTEHFFLIFCMAMIVKSLPMAMIVGVLRAGGDIRFCFYQDLGAQWLIGIPLTAFCALILKFPLEWLYAMLMLEEFVKTAASTLRIRSRAWMNNLVADESQTSQNPA